MWGPWREEPPSETVLMFCKLCLGSGNICVLCVSVAAGSLTLSPNPAVGAFGACEVERCVLVAANSEI